MKTNSIYLLLLFFVYACSVSKIYGQYCGTKPNASLSAPNTNIKEVFAKTRTTIRIPIKLFFVEKTEHLNFDLKEIQAKIDAINKAFSNAGIHFFLCGVPELVQGKKTYNYEDSSNLFEATHAPNALNVYVVNTINLGMEDGPPIFVSGFASFFSYVFLTNTGFQSEEIFIHEIGHHLGLWHTHEDYFGVELVDGSNCQEAGDFICDTPADPKLSLFYEDLYSTCAYENKETDPNGDIYKPDVTNYMSYAPLECLSSFTALQNQVMNYNARWLYFTANPRCRDIEEPQSYPFPNPINQDNLYLFFKNDITHTDLNITLTTSLGQVVKNIKNYRHKELVLQVFNVADLEKGFYILSVEYIGKDLIESFKVYKE